VAHDNTDLGESELLCRVNGQQILVGALVTFWLFCQGIGMFIGIPVMLQDKGTENAWVVCIVLGIVGILSLAMAITTLVRVVRTRGLEVEAFTDGLVWRQRGQSVEWHWSDVKEVCRRPFAVGAAPAYESLPVRFFAYACGHRVVYTVDGKDGERLWLTGYLENARELADMILENTLLVRLPKLLAAYKGGKTLEFGDLEVSRGGIARKVQTLPWNEVESVRLDGGQVTVTSRDGGKRWCKVNESRIPNAHLLVALVERVQESEDDRR
jgi:hypothetical protein